MTLNFEEAGKCTVSMTDYIEEMLEAFDDDM
jgi:hypothetical protein